MEGLFDEYFINIIEGSLMVVPTGVEPVLPT